VLDVKDLTVEFDLGDKIGRVKGLESVNLQVRDGEVLAIVGESGSGKTLTALSIAGLLPTNASITHGQVIFSGKDLTKLEDKQLSKVRATALAIVFQDPTSFLNPVMKVGDQIAELMLDNPELLDGDEDGKRQNKSKLRKQALDNTIKYLKQVRFADPERVVNMYPHELSGGMQQRVLIAAAIARKPKLVIADEITSSLDVTVQAQILGLLSYLKQTMNLTMLLITHDLGVVAQVADKVLVMYSGEVVEFTDVKSLFKEPKHPYTVALMNAVPVVEKSRTVLQSIPGSVPAITAPPTGCKFHPRCPHAFTKCKDEAPKLVRVKGNYVACHLYEGDGE